MKKKGRHKSKLTNNMIWLNELKAHMYLSEEISLPTNHISENFHRNVFQKVQHQIQN